MVTFSVTKKQILMKTIFSFHRFLTTLLFIIPFYVANSQDSIPNHFTTGADLYSTYIFRGTRYGSGPVVQPVVKFNSGIFTAGAWGSFDFHDYQEADVYFSFALPAGFSVGMTDYYFPGLDYFDYSKDSGSHAFEINAGFTLGNLSLSANYIINKAENAGSDGDDKYFEAKYSFKSFFLLAGAGDGWHSLNQNDGSDKFAVCNLALGTTRKIKVTQSFEIPVTGQVIVNPDTRKMYIIIGFTL
jgi:hypothetical protein